MNWSSSLGKFNVYDFDLCLKIFNLGLKDVFGMLMDWKFCMLIFYVGVLVYFSLRQYFYIKEYLEVLYIGCEDLLENNSNFFEV